MVLSTGLSGGEALRGQSQPLVSLPPLPPKQASSRLTGPQMAPWGTLWALIAFVRCLSRCSDMARLSRQGKDAFIQVHTRGLDTDGTKPNPTHPLGCLPEESLQ